MKLDFKTIIKVLICLTIVVKLEFKNNSQVPYTKPSI